MLIALAVTVMIIVIDVMNAMQMSYISSAAPVFIFQTYWMIKEKRDEKKERREEDAEKQ